MRVRRAREADLAPVARLAAEAFGEGLAGGAERRAAVVAETPGLEGLLEALERRFRAAAERELLGLMEAGLAAKALEGKAARLRNLDAHLRRQRAELARLQGGAGAEEAEGAEAYRRTAAAAPGGSYRERRARRKRMWNVLVAEDRATGEVLGSALVCWFAAEALLPPPFPTLRPHRLYLSNMNVRAAHRRRGVGRALLGQAEALARRWRVAELWLHVDAPNAAARALYEQAGFSEPEPDRWALGLGPRRLLLRKAVEGQDLKDGEGTAEVVVGELLSAAEEVREDAKG